MASIVTLVDVLDDVEIAMWAQENCPSFTGWVVVDMLHDTDTNIIMDFRFYFEDERDVLNFIMRWQGQYHHL